MYVDWKSGATSWHPFGDRNEPSFLRGEAKTKEWKGKNRGFGLDLKGQ